MTDYTLLMIPDPRGNGQTLPVYNLNKAQQGLIDDYATNSDQNRRYYQGVDTALTWRLGVRGSMTLSSSTGHVVTVTCQVTDPNSLLYCDQTALHIPFLTSFRGFGTYLLPYHDVNRVAETGVDAHELLAEVDRLRKLSLIKLFGSRFRGQEH